jgi:hypothetical protein
MTIASVTKNNNKNTNKNTTTTNLSPQLIHTKQVGDKKLKEVVGKHQQQQQKQKEEEEEKGYLEFLNLVHYPTHTTTNSSSNNNQENYTAVEDDDEVRDNNSSSSMSSTNNTTTSGSIFEHFICGNTRSVTTTQVLSQEEDDNNVWVPLDNTPPNIETTAEDGGPTPPPTADTTNNNDMRLRTLEEEVGLLQQSALESSSTTSASWSIGLVSPTNSLSSTVVPPPPPVSVPPSASVVAGRSYELRYNPTSFPKCGSYTTTHGISGGGAILTSPTTSPGGGNIPSTRGGSSIPVRCYRLNLERPLNIHDEHSPLEYGDYMSPWSMDVRPITVGPCEYCPPRHLGGSVEIWQELLRWNTTTTTDTTTANTTPHDDATTNNDSSNKGGEEEKKTNSNDTLENIYKPKPYWRKVSQDEINWIHGLNTRDGTTGEYTFTTYDISHVKYHQSPQLTSLSQLDGSIDTSIKLCYCHSNTTENEYDHIHKTEDMLADETARLFRRSELSLRELAESQAAATAAAGGVSLLEVVSPTTSATMVEGTTTTMTSATTTKSPTKKKNSMSKKLFGSMSKALDNIQGTPLNNTTSRSTTLSSSMTVLPQDLQQVRRGSIQAMNIDKARDLVDDDGGGGGMGGDDVNDDGVEEGGGIGIKKKPMNISLYIMGEYDILNDLAIDGARRLSEYASSSDIELLRMNTPCPPPNTWVRRTGWDKCNPSSMYAKDPPIDFDWEKYYDKLRLTTGPGMKRDSSINRQGSTIGGDGAVGITTTTANNNDGMINNNPQDILRKATGDALEGGIIIANQNTTTYPTSVSEFDLSQDIYHRIDGRLIKVTRADYVAEAVAAAVAVLPARSGASHFNKPKVSTVTTSPMSRSTPPLSKRATTGTATTTTTHTSNSTSLSHSASTPVISSTSSAAAAAAKPKKGLVRRMSSIMGKKK